ncbi:hypothetical protein J2T17_004455 [Paenibacillus mucilaginosus]|uniref:hypothetical protein n=1 Tax=Paenibacillus mucilaginosus TaxID=61624 RepID=UPI003D1AFAC3
MRVSFDRLDQALCTKGMDPETKALNEGALRVIEYMMNADRLSEIDFTSFTMKQAEHALSDVHWFECAESDKEAESNRNNLLTYINRHAHIRQLIDGIMPKKKKFF